MKLHYIISAIEELAPRFLQKSWDNSGLQIGLPPESDGECTGVLLCVDVTPEIIAEAKDSGCNLVVSHHPLIFKGLKALTGRTLSECAAAAAVRAGVAVYSAHTSLDSATDGISHRMAHMLGACVLRVLEPTKERIEKLTVFCPRDKANDVRLLMLDEPTALPVFSGEIISSTVSEEAESADGIPTFSLQHVPLTQVVTAVPEFRRMEVARRILDNLDNLDNVRIYTEALTEPALPYGLGVIADFETPVDIRKFPDMLRAAFGCRFIRANEAAETNSGLLRRIALCGGSGGEFINAAARHGVEAYVTADVRYHDFADHRSGMAIYDIGHYESENCAKSIFYEYLCRKFPNFAVRKSQLEHNPVKYL